MKKLGTNSVANLKEMRGRNSKKLKEIYDKILKNNEKLLLTILLLISISCFAQQQQQFDFKYNPVNTTPITDLSVLTATTAYWVYSDNVQPDKVIHFLFGYFATNAMYQLLSFTKIPKGLKICTPILIFGGLSFMKEAMLDGSPDWNDFKSGMLGCGIAAISFNISYTIKYKHYKKLQ